MGLSFNGMFSLGADLHSIALERKDVQALASFRRIEEGAAKD